MEVTFPTMFDYIKSINNKNYIYDVNTDKNYSQYFINYNFSLFPDTIHYANQLNEMKNISNKQHYDFLFYLIKKGNRFAKWHKRENPENVLAISDIFIVNRDKAKEIEELLSEEEIEELKNIKGGKNIE